MTKLYLSLRYEVPEERFEDAYTALSDVEHLGIAEAHDELMICLLHDGSTSFQAKEEERLQTLFEQFHVPATLLESQTIREENWNKEWEDSIEPVWVNERIIITPSWKAETVTAPTKLIINPQMSFGTGHHETTRMVAALLETSVKHDEYWIDAGTGTGVLAILALTLGAKKVFAFDNDEWAVMNTRENFERNNITSNSHTYLISQEDINTVTLSPCNGITANLHRNLLINNLKKFFQVLHQHNGTLIISGILRYDIDTVITAAQQEGFHHKETRQEGEWIAIKFTVS